MRNHKLKRLTTRGGTAKTAQNIRTHLRLPRQLYERARHHVQRQQTGSVNDFIVKALAAYVRALERDAIDDAFRAMADDKQYKREALRIVEQFAG